MASVNDLFQAIASGNVPKLETHLRLDSSNVNTFNELQQTPLIQAARLGQLDIVEILINYSADVNRTALGSSSALMLAVESQHKEVVKLLLRHNADSSFGSKAVGGGTVLAQALKLNLHEMADVLLRHGVDINARDKMGLTALMYAAIDGSYGEAKYLLDKGANPNITCNTLAMMGQKTALLAAAMHDHTSVVKLLLTRGATILPLHYREFIQRSEVVDTSDAQTCSELIRTAFEATDATKRETAVDLTATEWNAPTVTATSVPETSAVDLNAPPLRAPPPAGRGRGWQQTLPAWYTNTPAGDYLPRNCESMGDFHLYQQGLLAPPTRGPRFTSRLTNQAVTDPHSVAQFADAERRGSRGTDRNDPITLDSFHNNLLSHASQHQREKDDHRRSSERNREPQYSRDNFDTRQPPNEDSFHTRRRSRSRDRDRKDSQAPRSPPLSEQHHLYPTSHTPNIMMNYASVYTHKPPRAHPPKPLQPERAVVPDVDFDRSSGHRLPPPREVNSYAELDSKRRQTALDNPVTIATVSNTRRRSPSPVPMPVPRDHRFHSTEGQRSFDATPTLSANGAGRGRNHTLPAWMTATMTAAVAPPPPPVERATSPPREWRNGADGWRMVHVPVTLPPENSIPRDRSPQRAPSPCSYSGKDYGRESAPERSRSAVSRPYVQDLTESPQTRYTASTSVTEAHAERDRDGYNKHQQRSRSRSPPPREFSRRDGYATEHPPEPLYRSHTVVTANRRSPPPSEPRRTPPPPMTQVRPSEGRRSPRMSSSSPRRRSRSRDSTSRTGAPPPLSQPAPARAPLPPTPLHEFYHKRDRDPMKFLTTGTPDVGSFPTAKQQRGAPEEEHRKAQTGAQFPGSYAQTGAQFPGSYLVQSDLRPSETSSSTRPPDRRSPPMSAVAVRSVTPARQRSLSPPLHSNERPSSRRSISRERQPGAAPTATQSVLRRDAAGSSLNIGVPDVGSFRTPSQRQHRDAEPIPSNVIASQHVLQPTQASAPRAVPLDGVLDVGSFRATRKRPLTPTLSATPTTTAAIPPRDIDHQASVQLSSTPETPRAPAVVAVTPKVTRGGWRGEDVPVPRKRVFSMAELQATNKHPRGGEGEEERGADLLSPGRAAIAGTVASAEGVTAQAAPVVGTNTGASKQALGASTWLQPYLVAARLSARWVATCERVLVQEQGLVTREMYASQALEYFDEAHLVQLGLAPLAVQLELRHLYLQLQKECSEKRPVEGAAGVVQSGGENQNGVRVDGTEGSVVTTLGTGTDVEESGTLYSDASITTI